MYICTRSKMDNEYIKYDELPNGTILNGIDSIWDEEYLIKLNDNEACYSIKCNSVEKCEVCNVFLNSYGYYYFVLNNKSIIPITKKYYKEVKQ